MIDRIRRTARPNGEGRARIDPRAKAPAEFPPEPVVAAPVEAPEPAVSGRKRVNPHDAKARPAPHPAEDGGRRRVRPVATSVAAPRGAPTENVIRIDEPSSYVLVASLSEEPWSDAERELLAAARILADEQERGAVLLVRIDQSSPACDAATNGVDRLIEIVATSQPDRAAAVLLALIDTYHPRHLIFADTPVDGDVARRVAASLGERPASAVTRLSRGMATGRCDGGQQDYTRPTPRLLLLAAGTGDIVERAPRREARAVPPPTVAARQAGIIDLGPEPIDAAAVPLDQASFIVSAGDGVTSWPAFHDVAAALSGAVGGSRQVCDAGHLPRSRQVGASGTLVTAKCYLALGISGAPQHLQGVARCRYIVAVNTDLHAAMVKRADLSIIADAQDVMPALAKLARERRHGN